MRYLSVKEIAKKWNISERSVRNYCFYKRVNGVILDGKTYKIPYNATKPERIKNKLDNELLNRLKEEKDGKLKGGIYHKTIIELTYNSNHIEGSKLTNEETRYIFETNTIGIENNKIIKIDDIIETINHFECFDFILDTVNKILTESYIKHIHYLLKKGTSDSKKDWFNVGEYKKLPNEVGGYVTSNPEDVKKNMQLLLKQYNKIKHKTIDDIIYFHKRFESIHPFQDGNGRVGRIIMFKECLANNIVPFIIDEEHKLFYYRGLEKYNIEKGYLLETCLSCQDKYKKYLDYFRIKY